MRKKIKYIDKVKQPLVKPCPGAKGYFCCNYVVVSHILNCPYNCSYCYLHTFFGQDEIVVFKDEEEVIRQVKAYLEQAEEPLRVGTGEFSDSLALPDAISLGKKLVKVFAAQDRHLLELKTKSNNINELLDLEHNGRTVIAWSVNPEKIVQSEESGAAGLAERIEAVKKCVEAGYPVAFHFDPIIYYPGWEKGYRKVVELIFEHIEGKNIAWISLGALRFPERQKEIMEQKFKTRIPLHHMRKGQDTKLRYPTDLRIELFSQIYSWLRNYSQDVYVYLCMESEDVWQKAGILNKDSSIYSSYFEFSNISRKCPAVDARPALE
ncbi:radical SAM protein [Candidatus Margulisiibacteriota bacterium]